MRTAIRLTSRPRPAMTRRIVRLPAALRPSAWVLRLPSSTIAAMLGGASSCFGRAESVQRPSSTAHGTSQHTSMAARPRLRDRRFTASTIYPPEGTPLALTVSAPLLRVRDANRERPHTTDRRDWLLIRRDQQQRGLMPT